ncbi:MAG: S8 family peptidase [Elusimicrobia bacterium]|nr:S8 family peptidase [Elusimicrobiota bacterium]
MEEDLYQKWIEETPSWPELPSLESILSRLQDSKFVGSSEAQAEDPEGSKYPWGIERVQAPSAWAVTRGAGVKVCVVDTGVDGNHQDLRVLGGYNSIDPAASWQDDHGHGTHVSGTIAAKDNGVDSNGLEVVGVAPEAAIYAVKVLDSGGSGTYSDVIEGIEWCVKNRMDVVSMSLGASRGTPALEDIVRAAHAAGVVLVAAAGNSGGAVGYPAKYSEVIAISASDILNKAASFTSRGPEVEYIAPGVSVPSTYLGGGYQSLSGTSMACPHVSGLAALAISRGARGPSGVRTALTAAAQSLGLDRNLEGNGLVNAAKLVGAEEIALK